LLCLLEYLVSSIIASDSAYLENTIPCALIIA
jgi:hypothetical protein